MICYTNSKALFQPKLCHWKIGTSFWTRFPYGEPGTRASNRAGLATCYLKLALTGCLRLSSITVRYWIALESGCLKCLDVFSWGLSAFLTLFFFYLKRGLEKKTKGGECEFSLTFWDNRIPTLLKIFLCIKWFNYGMNTTHFQISLLLHLSSSFICIRWQNIFLYLGNISP